MSNPWPDSDDEGKKKSTKKTSKVTKKAPTTTTTTTTDAADKSAQKSPSGTAASKATAALKATVDQDSNQATVLSDEQLKKHISLIETDVDYLHSLIRKDNNKTGLALDEAIAAWEQKVGRKQKNRLPLFLPNGLFNTKILTPMSNASQTDQHQSIIQTAVSTNNVPAILRIFKWYLTSGAEMESSALLPVLEKHQEHKPLIAFIQAHSDIFKISKPQHQSGATMSETTIHLDSPERSQTIADCARMIGSHGAGLDTFLNNYLTTYGHPLINSSGYIVIGARVSRTPKLSKDDVDSELEYIGITFTYKNNQSLFRLALDCNNTPALRILLNHVAQNFPNSTPVPAIYDALKAENRLDYIPSLFDNMTRTLKSVAQKKSVFEHLLRHPITGESFFDVLFQRICNTQRLHNEYQFDGRVTFNQNTAQNQHFSAVSTTAGFDNTDPQQFIIQTQQQLQDQQQQHATNNQIPTSPQIYRLFIELLHAAVFAIWSVIQLFSVEDSLIALNHWVDNYNDKLKLLGFNRDSQVIASKREVSLKVMELFQSFAAAAKKVTDSLADATIPSAISFSLASYGNNRKKANNNENVNTPSIDFVEEFTLSTLIQFIPYLSPRWIAQALSLIPTNYIPLLNQLLPKLPSPYFRVDGHTSKFHIHQALYEFRTAPRPIPSAATDVNNMLKSLPVPPQILTATHLRLPSYLSTLSPLNTYPTDPTKAGKMYDLYNWDDSAVRSMQNERFVKFQTQLNPKQREEVHPILLLKFHPLTILQALYIHTTSPPDSKFFANPIAQLLLQQIDTLSGSFEDLARFSILDRFDSPALKVLADKNIPIPSHILPLLTPTLTDFAYFCTRRQYTDANEGAFYCSYLFAIMETAKLVNNLTKLELVKVITKEKYTTLTQLSEAASKWVVPSGIPSGSRCLTIAFMKDQSKASMDRLANPETFDERLNQYSYSAEHNLILDRDDAFTASSDQQQDDIVIVPSPALATTTTTGVKISGTNPIELSKHVNALCATFKSFGKTSNLTTMGDDDSDDSDDDADFDINNMDWKAFGISSSDDDDEEDSKMKA